MADISISGGANTFIKVGSYTINSESLVPRCRSRIVLQAQPLLPPPISSGIAFHTSLSTSSFSQAVPPRTHHGPVWPNGSCYRTLPIHSTYREEDSKAPPCNWTVGATRVDGLARHRAIEDTFLCSEAIKIESLHEPENLSVQIGRNQKSEPAHSDWPPTQPRRVT